MILKKDISGYSLILEDGYRYSSPTLDGILNAMEPDDMYMMLMEDMEVRNLENNKEESLLNLIESGSALADFESLDPITMEVD